MQEPSFSASSRQEALDNFKFSKKDCCNLSFLSGFFYRDFSEGSEKYEHRSDNEKTARTVKKLLSRYKISSHTETSKSPVSNAETYLLVIDDPASMIALHSKLYEPVFVCEDCPGNFIRGLFISGGSVTDPDKTYDLEFTFKDRSRADKIFSVLAENGFVFKQGTRKGLYTIYTKNSSVIEDFLAYVGASNSFMRLVQSEVEKNVRNRVNRQTNFEIANLSRTASAGRKYTAAAVKLKENGRLETLPDDLRILAEIKIENPEMSLSQLGKMMDPPRSKSTVSRKLAKIYSLAEDLK